MMAVPSRSLRDLRAALTAKGLDIHHLFDTSCYNSIVPSSLRLPTFSAVSRLALLVGNSKAIWPHFTRHHHYRCGSSHSLQPFDHYVETTVERACHHHLGPLPYQLRFAHHVDEGEFRTCLIYSSKSSHTVSLRSLDSVSEAVSRRRLGLFSQPISSLYPL